MMGLFGKGKAEGNSNAIWLYVRCDRCGEKIRIRADKRYDLNVDEQGRGSYVLHKEILGSRCPQLIYATVTLDAGYRVVGQEITGGQFITREEYEAS
jgi:hypothetical protein